MSRLATARMVYFGKLPARGDFVRSGDADGLTERLDQWLTLGIERLARDARWKETYDQAPPTSFAFLGVRRRAVVAGHLLASRDASGRRFPFAAAGHAEVDAPMPFMRCAPLALHPLWQQLGELCAGAHATDDVVPPLNALCQASRPLEIDPAAHRGSYDAFLQEHTLGSLQACHGVPDPRRTLLALGLLLRPVPGSGASALAKGVQLPLPTDPQAVPVVASLWIDLVARFLVRGDFEVALFLPHRSDVSTRRLAIGFSGDAPSLLHAWLDPAEGAERFVDLAAPAWADESAAPDHAVRKFASYVAQPQLSLAQAHATFNEAFLGE